MKGHKVVFVAVLIVLTVAGCARLPREAVPATPSEPGPLVSGTEVAITSERLQLFEDPQRSRLVYVVDGSRVYQGPVSQGQILLFFDGRRLYRGANTRGEILFTVDDQRVFVGSNTTGPPAYSVANGRVHQGSETGPVIYTIESQRVFRGSGANGKIVFQSDAELSDSVQFLLPILADRTFGTVRLFEDQQMTRLLYEIVDGQVYAGPGAESRAVLSFDGTTVSRGTNSNGEALFSVAGDHIFAGANGTGSPAYTLVDGRVHEGHADGPVAYTIEGNRMFWGPTPDSSRLLLVADRSLEIGDIRFLLPALVDGR